MLNRQVGGWERGANKNTVHVFGRPRANSADEEKEKGGREVSLQRSTV